MRSFANGIFHSLLTIAGMYSEVFCQCPPLYVFNGEAESDFCGYSVSSAGDVNNDGYSDLIFSAYSNDASGLDLGSVYVISGQDGDTLLIFHGEGPLDIFGGSVACAGDVNNDGFDDIIIGARRNDGIADNAGRVYVFSGQNGDTLFVLSGEAAGDNFGVSVSKAGDLDDDGFADIIIGAHANDGNGIDAGRAYVFSGQTKDTLYVFSGELGADYFGFSVSSAGDINKDGYSDVIIGARYNDGGDADKGRAYVFSGHTGDTLYVFTGESPYDYFGWSVSWAGDVNNDSFDDVIIGATGHDFLTGRTYVFSGQNGDNLYVFDGKQQDDVFGISVSTAGDVNKDDYDDIIIGAYGYDFAGLNDGRAYVFSGKTGDTLRLFNGEAAEDLFGWSVSAAGDVDNDGFDDVIIGAYMNDVSGIDAGRAYVFSCCCFGSRGDVNGDGSDADILDLIYLVDRIFRGGPNAPCVREGDVNSDTASGNILDLTFIVDRIFRGGPMPGPC